MTAKVTGWALSACAAVLTPMLLGGCFGIDGRSAESLASVDQPSPVATAEAGPPVRTVKRSGSQMADAETSPSRGSGLPAPSEIFDFHPPGSKRDAWRQPFIIDPNDGPLAGYVRRMDAELDASNRETATADRKPVRKRVCPSGGPAGTIATGCGGENEVAKSLAR